MEKYVTPSMEIVFFETEDVITTSETLTEKLLDNQALGIQLLDL